MPYRQTRTRRAHFNVLADQHYTVGESRMFEASYITYNSDNERWIYAGLLVAEHTTTGKYVPYNASASYGAGSDTAVGILKEPYDVTNGDEPVAPVTHATVHERFCYLWGGAVGTVPSGAKTNLSLVQWR